MNKKRRKTKGIVHSTKTPKWKNRLNASVRRLKRSTEFVLAVLGLIVVIVVIAGGLAFVVHLAVG